MKRLDFVINEGGISEIQTVELGGVTQTILIQGENPANPILLVLHGGPSLPLPGVSSKGSDYTIVTNTKELVRHFVLVFWDQRGTGRSYNKSIPGDSMTIEQFVSDTIDLTDYLRTRFQHKKIFLAGHSWGSILGLKAVSQHPEKYYSYTGLSQIISWTENDRLGLQWTMEEAIRRKNTKALTQLQAVGEPPFVESFKQWGVLRKWQQRFGTIVHSDNEIKGPSLIAITLSMLKSGDYSIKDMYNTFYKGFKLIYSDEFIKSLVTIDFIKTTKKMEIPVTFVHGRKDVHVHGQLVKAWYEKLESNQGKRFLWMEKSGHAFHPEDTARIEQQLIEELNHFRNRGD